MTEKLIGYSLLILGVLLIIVPVINVAMVFTGRAQPFQLFNFEGIGIDASALISEGLPSGQKVELVDAAMINSTSNLFAHLFLMGFITTAGFKLASLGTMMARPIVVKLREANDTPQTQK